MTISPRSLFACGLLVFACAAQPALAGFAKVSVTADSVDALTPAERDAHRDALRARNKSKKAKGPLTETTKCKIVTQISNVSKVGYPDAKVKYYITGMDKAFGGVQILAEGEVPVAIEPAKTVKVESPVHKFTFTGAGVVKKERVDATGEKMTGFGVLVVSGTNEVLGEFFTSDTVKQLATKNH